MGHRTLFKMGRILQLAVVALTLTQEACLTHARQLRASQVFVNSRDVDKEYDYIIVGGGTAGLTVADRLTEDGTSTVLVVEYGELSMADTSFTFTPCFPH